jgi:hypothetical protein
MKARRIALFATALAVGATTVASLPAGATGSATAGDTKTREVGSALATCTPTWLNTPTDSLVANIYYPVAGKGAVLAQSNFINNVGGEMAKRLRAGVKPVDIIADYQRINAEGAPKVTDKNHPDYPLQEPEGFTTSRRRQYLISSLDAPGAAHTGDSDEVLIGTPTNRGDKVVNGNVRGVVGGNTLTSTSFVNELGKGIAGKGDVIERLETLLGEPISKAEEKLIRRDDLAERLFMSLAMSFGQPGQGDRRCIYNADIPPAAGTPIPAGARSSRQGWIRVDAADGSTPMDLRVDSLYNKDAVVELARLYKACRLGTGLCVAKLNDTTAKPATPTYGVEGTKLLMRDTAKDWFAAEGKSDSLKNLSFDPRVIDTSVQIRVDAKGTANDTDNTYALPKANWTKLPGRYQYTDTKNLAGPFADVDLLTNSGRVSVAGANGGFAWNLSQKPATVEVIVRAGTTVAYCMRFTGGTYSANQIFQSQYAPAPVSCA